MFLASAVGDQRLTDSIRGTSVAHNHSGFQRGLSSALLIVIMLPLVLSSMKARAAEQHQQMIATTNNFINNKEPVPFYEALTKALKKRKIKLEDICPPADGVARRILEEYGAVYVATKKVTPPPVCIFTHEEKVTRFQENAGFDADVIGYACIAMQIEALNQLKKEGKMEHT